MVWLGHTHICCPLLGWTVTSTSPYKFWKDHGTKNIILAPSTSIPLSAISNQLYGCIPHALVTHILRNTAPVLCIASRNNKHWLKWWTYSLFMEQVCVHVLCHVCLHFTVLIFSPVSTCPSVLKKSGFSDSQIQ